MTARPEQISSASPQPPSRHDNPFATCWTRPGALPFHFADHQNVDQLIEQLAGQNWRGAIIGPHGSGKSTLLESIKPALREHGKEIFAISLHNGERRLPRDFWPYPSQPAPLSRRNTPSHLLSTAANPPLIIIDGYEQLSWLERLRIARRCRRTNVGLLITTHKNTRIPKLVQLLPSRHLIAQLVADLCAEVSTPITMKDVDASHACHGSNVREIFFDFYDRHEQRRRSIRTEISGRT